jgi:hypothetical protein
MRKLFYLGFCLVLVMGLGCAISNYRLMTDTWSGEVINTNGKALIQFDQGLALGDGTTWFNFFTMVDQKAGGDRVLNTYTAKFDYSVANPFKDFFYCTPDWIGCAVLTAQDPEDPADDPFDFVWNTNCDGALQLSYVLDSDRYYGECGRAAHTVQDRLNFLASGNMIDEYTLGYNLNAGNTSVILDNNAGVRSLVPVLGSISLELNTFKGNSVMLDMSNPLFSNTLRWMADWNDTYGTGATQMTVIYNGIVRTTDISLISDGLNHRANQL